MNLAPKDIKIESWPQPKSGGGSDDAPIAVYTDKPKCFDAKERGV